MKNNYLCHKCRSLLNIGNKIIFSAKSMDGKLGLILLSSEVGDYSVSHHPTFPVMPGEHYNFFCPLCKYNLAIPEVNENLAKVLMIDESNEEHLIVFSGIAGEKATYRIKDEDVEHYGENAGKYINFLNLASSK